jgi:small multidrug resistance family-3 protein
VLFVYGIIPTLQSSHFHRIYAAYGEIFIIMAIAWGWIFERIAPDVCDVIGASLLDLLYHLSDDWIKRYCHLER